MKTYIVQKNIFNTEKILEDLSSLVSLWEEENMEISSDDEKSKPCPQRKSIVSSDEEGSRVMRRSRTKSVVSLEEDLSKLR